jgi:hypothetical protein
VHEPLRRALAHAQHPLRCVCDPGTKVGESIRPCLYRSAMIGYLSTAPNARPAKHRNCDFSPFLFVRDARRECRGGDPPLTSAVPVSVLRIAIERRLFQTYFARALAAPSCV